MIEQIAIAATRQVPAYGMSPAPKLIIDVCPYCGETHRHSLSKDDGFPIYGRRESDCLRGEYLLVDESEAK